MKQFPQSPGPIAAAVSGHHPTPAVLYEAGALDRELADPRRSWKALLGGIRSFAAHYPSVLLHSPGAVKVLGRTCLSGIQESPGRTLQRGFATLLVNLLTGMVSEADREGAAHCPPELPRILADLMSEMVHQRDVWSRHTELTSAMLELGRQILALDDAEEPEAWLALLSPLCALLIEIRRVQIQGEPSYDGRWNDPAVSEIFQVDKLNRVSQDRILDDLKWLDETEKRLVAGDAPADVFLELTSFSLRNDREKAWEEYFMALAQGVQQGTLQGENLRQLCLGVADWLEQTGDPRLLMKLARILNNHAPAMAAVNGLAGLLTALDTFGRKIIDMLEKQTGRGEQDPAYEGLRLVVSRVITGLLDVADKKVAVDAVQTGLRLRTGPLVGAPFSLEDVVWRIELIAGHPDVAEGALLSLVAGFSLEDLLLRDDHQRVGKALASLLGRSWDRHLLFLVRAAIRKTPLTPFHLGGPSIRAHLQALDPGNQAGSYLHDFKEKMFSQAGQENLMWVEKVLQFWRTGSPEHLDNLATPRSLTNLPGQEQSGHLGHVRRLLQNLDRHAPVPDKSGIEWLAWMPEAYYQADNLIKVAGFEGCPESAVSLVEHLLNIYRTMVQTYQAPDRRFSESVVQPEEMLERSRSILDSRRLLLGRLFHWNGLENLEPLQRLEVFEHELSLVQDENLVLEDLAIRGLRVLDRGSRREAQEVLGHMLIHLDLSGMGPPALGELARSLQQDPPDEAGLLKILRKTAGLLASTRNGLAEKLQPYVEESSCRLMQNPLARPNSAYRQVVEAHRHRGVERLAIELGDALIDDLLSVDGGFLMLETFVHRLLHMLEQY